MGDNASYPQCPIIPNGSLKIAFEYYKDLFPGLSIKDNILPFVDFFFLLCA